MSAHSPLGYQHESAAHADPGAVGTRRRVLWLSSLVPYPPKGGVLQRSYNLLRETARYHDVDLLAFNQRALMRAYYPGGSEEGLADARRVLSGLCRRMEFVDIPSDRISGGKHLLALGSLLTRDPYTVNWQKSARFARLCREWAENGQYDLVHLDMITLGSYRELFGDTPVTLGHHNVESHLLQRRAENTANPITRWYFAQEGRRLARYEQEQCSRYALNITCSELDRERLHEITPESRTEVIPNGVDLEYFRPHDGAEQPDRLIFAGMLNWLPNRRAVEYIAHELWPRIKASRPDACIDIVGPNPPESVLALARQDRNFVVHGYVDDVRPYIDAAAVYLCPIKDGGGTKLKLLDAFAMRKAVVADPISCEGIEVEDGKHVILASEPDEYVAAIERLLTDASERARVGHSAQEFVQRNYSFAVIGRSLAEHFDRYGAGPSAAAKPTV
ncbi:MAG: glycosyltransferase family 4 protein [Halofilum sp. (in: g-proteobacteria)]